MHVRTSIVTFTYITHSMLEISFHHCILAIDTQSLHTTSPDIICALETILSCSYAIFHPPTLYLVVTVNVLHLIFTPVAGAMEIILSSGLNGEGASVEGELPVTRSNSKERTHPQMFIGCLFLLGSTSVMVNGSNMHVYVCNFIYK